MAKPPKTVPSTGTGLVAAIAAIEKAHGKGSIRRMSDETIVPIPVISTGLLELDVMMGVGGIPRGRIGEIYGPESSGKTTLALHLLAQAQRYGPVAVIDAEHALDPAYAAHIGVNMDRLLLSQPDSGEQAMQIARLLVNSGEVIMIVVDSVAAMTPLAEIQGEIGDQTMGALARLMGQSLRIMTPGCSTTGTSLIFINQIREKIGVLYGCERGDTQIGFVDGTSAPIRKVVEDRIDKQVWAWDEDTQAMVPARITNWFNNGKVHSHSDFLHVKTDALTKNGMQGVILTPNHRVMTSEDGWVEAQNLDPTAHTVVSRYPDQVNGTLKSCLLGAVIGDSHFAHRKHVASLSFEDDTNPEYLQWKLEMLAPFFQFRQDEVQGPNRVRTFTRYQTDWRHDLHLLSLRVPKRSPLGVITDPDFNAISWAVWYMDDGSLRGSDAALISVKRMKKSDNLTAVAQLVTQAGYSCAAQMNQGAIRMDSAASHAFFKRICEYVPPCMQYKLPAEFRGRYVPWTLEAQTVQRATALPIRSIGPATFRSGWLDKYDLEVEGYHNYVAGHSAGGFVVHNSPETQPGGRALKFYASFRIDVRRVEAIKDGTDQIGAKTKLKTVKNKVGPPFKQVEIPMYFGEGLSRSVSAIKVAVPLGVVVTNGSFHYYLGEPLGNGAAAVREYLDGHPDVLESIIMDSRKILWPVELLQAPARDMGTKIDQAGSIVATSTEAITPTGEAASAGDPSSNGKTVSNGKMPNSTPTATAKTIKAVTDDPIAVAMREAVRVGVVSVRGSHHYFRGKMLGQGNKVVRALLTTDPSILADIIVDTELALSPPPATLDPVVPTVPEEAINESGPAQVVDLNVVVEPQGMSNPSVSTSTDLEPDESEYSEPDDDADVDQSVQDGFKVRDWFEANPGILMDAVELSGDLGIDAVRVVLQCERLAATGRISQPDPNETIFIYR